MEFPGVSSDVVCQFLEAAIHHVLWKRGLYPEAIFVSRLAFSVPIKTSIHPGVNEYVTKSLKCFRDVLAKPQIEVQGIDLVITNDKGEVIERFAFQFNNIQCFQTDRSEFSQDEELEVYEIPPSVNNIFRGCLLRLINRLTDLPDLLNPKECSYTVQIHLSENGEDYLAQNHIDVPWIRKENSVLSVVTKHTKTIPVFRDRDPFELEVFIDLIQQS